jgi:hypothetical protein
MTLGTKISKLQRISLSAGLFIVVFLTQASKCTIVESDQQEIISWVLTNFTNLTESAEQVAKINNAEANANYFSFKFKLAYVGLILCFLILAFPSFIVLNSFILLLFDYVSCFKRRNPCLIIYKQLSLIETGQMNLVSDEIKKQQRAYSDPIELKHFKYCYASDVHQVLKNGSSSDENMLTSPGGHHSNSFMTREGVKKSRMRSRSNSNEKNFSTIDRDRVAADPIQELDRIEKHLSRSICDLDEMHKNLRESNKDLSRKVSAAIDMREADALINDLIEELNIDRDLDNRLKTLEIVETSQELPEPPKSEPAVVNEVPAKIEDKTENNNIEINQESNLEN